MPGDDPPESPWVDPRGALGKFSVRRAIMKQRQIKNALSRAGKFVLKVFVQAFVAAIIQKIIGYVCSP
jgi:hypothetical protein